MHAQRARVGNYRASRLSETGLEFGSDACVQCREDNFRSVFGLCRGNTHSSDAGRDRRLHPPARGLGIETTFGAVRGSQPSDLEPGMVLQHLDETLSHNAGSTQNSYWSFHLHGGDSNSLPSLLARADLAPKSVLIQRSETPLLRVDSPPPEHDPQPGHHRTRQVDPEYASDFASRQYAEDRCQGVQFHFFTHDAG